MKGLIVLVCNQPYQYYLPFYIYFTLSKNPNCFIAIYTDTYLEPGVNKCLELLYATGYENFDLIKLPWEYDNPQTLKSFRWLIYDHNIFPDYDYYYTGDIDLPILQENFHLGHLEHCKHTSFSYSNVKRTSTNKMSGLHFSTPEYFDKTLDTIYDYQTKLENNDLEINESYTNEHLLFDIISKSDLGYTEDITNFPLHNGIHLRVFNNHRTLKQLINSNNYRYEIFENYYQTYKELTKEKIFISLLGCLINIDQNYLDKYRVNFHLQFKNISNIIKELEKK